MSELSEAMIEAGVKALNTSDMVMRDSRSACERAQVERIYLAMSRASLPSMSEELVERASEAYFSAHDAAPKAQSPDDPLLGPHIAGIRAAISVVLGG